MIRLRKLLLPVDYSERCLTAAACVKLLGARSAVEVSVLHVTDTGAQRRADERLIRALSDRLAGFDVGFAEIPGDPADGIIEYSRSNGTDLIVMPTRGGGVIRRVLRRSVTARVLGKVNCPVWTGTLPEERVPLQIAKVACGIDLGPESGHLLRWASDFADNFGASLTVIHANTQLAPIIGVVHDPEWRLRVAQVLREQLSELLARTGVRADIRLARGEPIPAVAGEARRSGADVLVIGRTPAGLVRRLRPKAFGIIRHSPCAVISIDPTVYRPYELILRHTASGRQGECMDSDLALAGPEMVGTANIRERVR